MEQPKQYTPEEIAELEKSRTISDAELLKGGAEYVVDEGGNKKLIATHSSILGEIKETASPEEENERQQEFYKKLIQEKGVGVDSKATFSYRAPNNKSRQEVATGYYEGVKRDAVGNIFVRVSSVPKTAPNYGYAGFSNSFLARDIVDVTPGVDSATNDKLLELENLSAPKNRGDGWFTREK